MKILIAGDSHGDAYFLAACARTAKANGCSLVIQVGDFGLWPGPYGVEFLNDVEDTFRAANLELWWLDGNHEDHAKIQTWKKRDGFWTHKRRVRNHIFYLPRGYRFELGGLRFMSLGGAWSIDKDGRTPFIDWWPQEELTEAEVARAVEDTTPIDVLLSHDMPALAEAYAKFQWMSQGGEQNRKYVSYVADMLGARLHVHGHMHKPYILKNENRATVGLDCNTKQGAAIGVLDTDECTFRTLFGSTVSFAPHERYEPAQDDTTRDT